MDNLKKKYLKVDVAGKSEDLWKKMRVKLIDTVNKFLDTTIDSQNHSSIREEAKEFTTKFLKHAKDKLERAGLENEKIVAEIDSLYSSRQRESAQTRKLNAEASEIELSVSIKKLKLSLGLTKAILIGDAKNEDIVFAKQIDSFLEMLKEFQVSK
ncbi:MAG: hypothetical protein GQ574_24815 [Crocinitomix sp.]|nr:hypothetical protein [Crocinitomix sp.]